MVISLEIIFVSLLFFIQNQPFFIVSKEENLENKF